MIELWLQLFAKRGSGSGGPGASEESNTENGGNEGGGQDESSERDIEREINAYERSLERYQEVENHVPTEREIQRELRNRVKEGTLKQETVDWYLKWYKSIKEGTNYNDTAVYMHTRQQVDLARIYHDAAPFYREMSFANNHNVNYMDFASNRTISKSELIRRAKDFGAFLSLSWRYEPLNNALIEDAKYQISQLRSRLKK